MQGAPRQAGDGMPLALAGGARDELGVARRGGGQPRCAAGRFGDHPPPVRERAPVGIARPGAADRALHVRQDGLVGAGAGDRQLVVSERERHRRYGRRVPLLVYRLCCYGRRSCVPRGEQDGGINPAGIPRLVRGNGLAVDEEVDLLHRGVVDYVRQDQHSTALDELSPIERRQDLHRGRRGRTTGDMP